MVPSGTELAETDLMSWSVASAATVTVTVPVLVTATPLTPEFAVTVAVLRMLPLVMSVWVTR